MSTEAQKRASIKWQKNNMRRVPIDVRPEYYDTTLKPAADDAGQSVRAFVLQAIDERITRMKGGTA